MEISFKVTRNDIMTKPEEGSVMMTCMIARSISRRFPNKVVIVGIDTVRIGDMRLWLPLDVVEKMGLYDLWVVHGGENTVKPFSFKMKIEP